MAEPAPHILILGGTAEARELAALLAGAGRYRVTTSLAGATTAPLPVESDVRRGGFGGAAGLAAFLQDQRVAAMVDATHPFATVMTKQAAEAAALAGVRWLRLERPAWRPEPGDRWHRAADLAAALTVVPALGRRVLVALGHRQAALLPPHPALAWVVRSIEPPPTLPAGALWVPAELPFSREADRALLTAQRIDVVLAKASGGEAARTKLDAARDLGLPVVLLERPPSPSAADLAGSPESAVLWLTRSLAGG